MTTRCIYDVEPGICTHEVNRRPSDLAAMLGEYPACVLFSKAECGEHEMSQDIPEDAPTWQKLARD